MPNNITVLLLIITMGTVISDVSGHIRSHRMKRKIVFVKGSKFFVRLNFKANTLPYTNVFAWAAGYKLNFELPQEAKALPFRYHRRSLYENFETIIDQNGLNGRSCVLRFLCEAAELMMPTDGLFQKLVKLVFTVPEGAEHTIFPYHIPKDCNELASDCPLSLLHILSLEQIEHL
ncbi:uncharacterized protein [Periplaneta americana]|uniref:uncharacterized protein n=1 Tax=Periplaneta americana TaxID=6978 RepID=UPI0037E7C1B0